MILNEKKIDKEINPPKFPNELNDGLQNIQNEINESVEEEIRENNLDNQPPAFPSE